MTRPPWWTAADQAGLDALVDAVAGPVWEHWQACAACAAAGRLCDLATRVLDEALAIIEAWLTTRALMSRTLALASVGLPALDE